MKKNLIATASAVVASACLALAAAADITVAGWDFSQYSGDGILGGLNTLPANYSTLDPTHNAGFESSAFGTAHFDGLFSSTNTTSDFLPTAGTMNCERLPTPPKGCATPNTEGPVRSNRTEPFSDQGQNPFDSLTVQKAEGQPNANLLAMTAKNSLSVVFETNVGAGQIAGPYSISFGGKTFTGSGTDGGEPSCAGACSSTVGIDFSTNGVTFSPVGSVVLTPNDTRYNVLLGGGLGAQKGYVRLNFNPSSGQPIIDNVAVSVKFVPEPGAVAQLCAGVAGLGLLARRRFRA
jgi:hypothetical protein